MTLVVASESPTHADVLPPKRDVVALGLTDGVELTRTGEPARAFSRLDAAWGLPLGHAVRAALPLVDTGESVRGGSALAAVAFRRTLRLKTFAAWFGGEVGVTAPSLAAPDFDFVDQRIAREKTAFWFAASVGALHGPTGISLSWEQTVVGAAALAGWQDPSARFVIHGGYRPKYGEAPSQVQFDCSLGLSSDVRLGVFGAVPVGDTPLGIQAGLGLRWDAPVSAATRTSSTPGTPDIHAVHDARLRDVSMLAVKGKITIVEMGAEWCIPCVYARPELLRRAHSNADLAIRLVDVDEALELSVHALPTFVVFDASGHRVGEVVGLDLKTLDVLVDTARKR